jgi:hypothetical protein
MADDTDEGLIRELAVLHARTRVGDEPATGRLIALLYGRVRAYVRRRLDRYPPDVVADAVHEAMAAVVEQLPSCRAVGGRQLVRWAVVVGWHAALRFVQSPAAGTAVRWDAVTLDVIITVPGDGQSGGPCTTRYTGASRRAASRCTRPRLRSCSDSRARRGTTSGRTSRDSFGAAPPAGGPTRRSRPSRARRRRRRSGGTNARSRGSTGGVGPHRHASRARAVVGAAAPRGRLG